MHFVYWVNCKIAYIVQKKKNRKKIYRYIMQTKTNLYLNICIYNTLHLMPKYNHLLYRHNIFMEENKLLNLNITHSFFYK